MKRGGISWFFLQAIPGIFLCSGAFQAHAEDSTATTVESVLVEIESALAYIKLSSSDLALRTDYVDLDSFRLEIVNQVMLKPTDMAAVLDSAAKRVFVLGNNGNPGSFPGCLEIVDRALGRRSQDFADSTYLMPHSEEKAVSEALAAIPRAGSKLDEWLRTFPAGGRLFFSIYAEYAQSDETYAGLIADRNPEDIRFLIDTLPQLLIEDPEMEFYPPAKIDSLQKVAERIAARFTGLSGKINWRDRIDYLRKSGRKQIFLLNRLIEDSRAFDANLPGLQQFDAKVEWETGQGKVAFGSTGNDHYAGKYFFIFDPAGNDIYELDSCGPGENQFVYDLSGDDLYTTPRGYAAGCGFFGVGLLYDQQGNDTYRAGNFSLGCGFFGAGILIDMAGNDCYVSDTYSQGAGGLGYGFIYDHDGTDQYSAALYSQGFGFAAGIGLLADRQGNDSYFAGGKYKDVLRYADHYLSLSQGFSFGARPDFSGGVGWLLDGSGNDIYTADIFAQGAAYWWAFGGLYDGGGNDSYNCFQYGQGCATHMAAGILHDGNGDDVYFGKGLMQGCGHDRSTGWIVELAGNDTYVSWDLSQGAGSANGTGILTDGGGDDRYYVKRTANTQGYGNPRSDFGSIGLFVDLRGQDRYDGNGRDDDIWIIDSKWGVGVDKNSVPQDTLK